MGFKKPLIVSLAAVFLFTAALFAVKLNAPEGVEVQTRPVSQELIMEGSVGAGYKLLPGEKLNINTATAEELTALPGIGDALAAQIIAYREENGAFAAAEDIMKVSGIGEKRFEALRDYITVEDDT